MMSVHAQSIPSIATGIACLRHAHSASLREKLDIISRKETGDNDSQNSEEPEADGPVEVKRRLWLLCQTRIRPGPIKGRQIRKKADETAVGQSPSQLLAGREVETLPHYTDDFDSETLIFGGDYDLTEQDDPYAVLPGVSDESSYLEVAGLLPIEQPYMLEDGEPSSDNWTHSSEGDYFYTDGQGNVYPVERQEAPDDEQADWPSTPQLVDSEGFDHAEDEGDVPWDESVNEAYIMYHEVQHWSAVPGVQIHAVDGPGRFPPLPPPDDEPLNDWGD